MSKFKFSPLKVGGLVVAAVGFLIAQEIQRRETEEYIDKAIAKREDAAYASDN